jgi:hypothetical protein
MEKKRKVMHFGVHSTAVWAVPFLFLDGWDTEREKFKKMLGDTHTKATKERRHV